MKDSRFIELLNLYVDQQLTGTEVAELENEIQRTPHRRRTYQQYCRMQKACTVLFEHDRSQAPSSRTLSRALAEADRKIVAFPEERSFRTRGTYAAGVAAMAACVAFLFVRHNPSPSPTAIVPVEATAVAVAPAVMPVAQPVIIPPADPRDDAARPTYYSVLSARQLAHTAQLGETESSHADQTFDWMQRVELPPLRRISVEELAFDTTPTARTTATASANRRSTGAQYENAAFQFQK